jgi:hypothetical protein
MDSSTGTNSSIRRSEATAKVANRLRGSIAKHFITTTEPTEFLNKAVYDYVLARDLDKEYTPQQIDEMIAKGLDDIERGDTIAGGESIRHLRTLRDRWRSTCTFLFKGSSLGCSATLA